MGLMVAAIARAPLPHFLTCKDPCWLDGTWRWTGGWLEAVQGLGRGCRADPDG